ncbi:LAFA_0F05578g1_1 [Lachancea sp. 'fantastica']|nr:LAFA_0F05578g1_1 [Lachancea sp. 'fantastica']
MATLYAIDQRPLRSPSVSMLPLHKCIALDNGPQGKQVLLPAPELNLAQLADWESDLKRQLDRWAFATGGSRGTAGTPEPEESQTSYHATSSSLSSSSSTASLSSLSTGKTLGSLPVAQPQIILDGRLSDLSARDVAAVAAAATITPHGNRVKPSIERRRKYVCKTCDKGFTTSGHLARHKRIHTGEKNHVCPHAGCGQRFSRHDNCVQHYKTHLRA